MKYAFAVAALAAGAQASYSVAGPPPAVETTSAAEPVVSSSSAAEEYPVATPSVSSAAEVTPVASKSSQEAYPVASSPSNGTTAVEYTTEIVDQYTTYCPGPTQITYGTKTYTVTEATSLTITDCPCTVSKPIYTTSSVVCSTCTAVPVPPPTYNNGTASNPGYTPTTLAPAPTGGYPTKATTPGTPVPTAGAAKVAGAAGFAGLLAVLAL